MHPQEIVYTGKQIQPTRINGSKAVIVKQSHFTEAAEIRHVPKSRTASTDTSLTHEETTEFKSVTGELQWLSGQSRPDLSAPTSLLQHKDLKVADFVKAYTALKIAKNTSQAGVCVQALPLSEMIAVGYGDASWGNAELKT